MDRSESAGNHPSNMDTSITLKKQELKVFGILKEALAIISTNTNLFFFTLIISLPLFCFLIYYESLLLNVLVDISAAILTLPHNDFYFSYFDWPLGIIHRLIPGSLNNESAFKLIQLALLYLLPLHLLEFFTSLITVDLASEVFKEDRTMTLNQMLRNPIGKAKLRSTFITCACVLFLSTSTLLGLIWLVINYCVFWRNLFFHGFFAVLYGAAFVALLVKYLEWSAQWSMSVVISVLEQVRGVEALALSAYFSRGSEKRGLLLMIVFFFWGVGIRLPCLLFGCPDGGNRIVVQVLLYCFGNVIKWVACMVYYYDCKQRILDKKVDVEVGTVVQAADE